MDEETRTITLNGLKEGFLNERYIQYHGNELKLGGILFWSASGVM